MVRVYSQVSIIQSRNVRASWLPFPGDMLVQGSKYYAKPRSL